MGYFESPNDKSATTLKSTAFVAYLDDVVSMNCSAEYHLWLVENGHTAVGSESVRVGSDLKQSSAIHEWQSTVYWFTGTNQVHCKETWRFSSQMNSRQKKMSYYMIL